MKIKFLFQILSVFCLCANIFAQTVLAQNHTEQQHIIAVDSLKSVISIYEDSLQKINSAAVKFKETAKIKIDSVKSVNVFLQQQLEDEKSERFREKWLASKIVYEKKEKEFEEYNKDILKNKMFYLGLWGGGGTGFKDSKGINGGFSVSWQTGKVFALRGGIDWIRTQYVYESVGYRGEKYYVQDTKTTMQIPAFFEWAVRKGIISAEIYFGAYFKGNMEEKIPGISYGIDIGVKAWQGYGYIGFQSGMGIVEYDKFNTMKIGYKFGLATKKSYKEGKTKNKKKGEKKDEKKK